LTLSVGWRNSTSGKNRPSDVQAVRHSSTAGRHVFQLAFFTVRNTAGGGGNREVVGRRDTRRSLILPKPPIMFRYNLLRRPLVETRIRSITIVNAIRFHLRLWAGGTDLSRDVAPGHVAGRFIRKAGPDQ